MMAMRILSRSKLHDAGYSAANYAHWDRDRRIEPKNYRRRGTEVEFSSTSGPIRNPFAA